MKLQRNERWTGTHRQASPVVPRPDRMRCRQPAARGSRVNVSASNEGTDAKAIAVGFVGGVANFDTFRQRQIIC
jgi:hypothetical protein